MFKCQEAAVLRSDLKLARQQRGETAAATRARRVTILSHDEALYRIQLPDGTQEEIPEADLARVAPRSRNSRGTVVSWASMLRRRSPSS
jgi:predicted 2-oxoglutarate/Fe(II)-dependent dioxygenase YbiX